MQPRWIDGIWAGGLALSVSAIALLLLPNARRVALLFGISAGATAGVTLMRTRAITAAEPRSQAARPPRRRGSRTVPSESAALRALDSLTEARPATAETPSESPAALLQSALREPDRVLTWLSQRQISVKSYSQAEPSDRIFAELALLLGEKYANAVPFYEQIKRHLSSGHGFQVSLANKSPQEIADTTQLGHRLSAYALLAGYRYDRKAKTIYAVPPSSGQAINFFSGGWFERFALIRIVRLLTANRIDFQCLLNSKVTLPNQNDCELDLLFLLASGQPLWIECKTGDYQAYITKYAEIRKLLGIPVAQAILLVLDLPDALAADLSQLYGLTVANQTTFLPHIARWLDLALPEPRSAAEPLTEAQAQLRALLSRLEMRPLPQHRQHILEQLVAIFQTLDEPKNLIEIKFLLASRTQNLVSKTKLQDILNVLVRRECFLNAAGAVVSSRKEPIAQLVSATVADLEQRCVEGYAYAALASDVAYFNSEANRATFAAVVGQPAPEPTAIAHLQTRRQQDLTARQSSTERR